MKELKKANRSKVVFSLFNSCLQVLVGFSKDRWDPFWGSFRGWRLGVKSWRMRTSLGAMIKKSNSRSSRHVKLTKWANVNSNSFSSLLLLRLLFLRLFVLIDYISFPRCIVSYQLVSYRHIFLACTLGPCYFQYYFYVPLRLVSIRGWHGYPAVLSLLYYHHFDGIDLETISIRSGWKLSPVVFYHWLALQNTTGLSFQPNIFMLLLWCYLGTTTGYR